MRQSPGRGRIGAAAGPWRVVPLLRILALATVFAVLAQAPAEAARYRVACIAPNGPWCRIACQSNRGVACYANVVYGRCQKVCRYN